MPSLLVSRFHLDSLRRRLALLVLLALVPPMVLNVVGSWQERTREVRSATVDLQRLTRLAAANEARFIEGARQYLTALADVPDVRGDAARCSAFLRRFLKKNDGYLNLGVIQLNGDVSCSAVPMPGRVDVHDRSHFQRAVEAQKFITGDYVFGRVLGRHTVILSYPVLDESGRMQAVLFAAIDLGALDLFAGDINLPPGAVLITADRNGTVLSQRPDPGRQRVGKPVAARLIGAMRAGQPRTIELTEGDGIARLYAFAPVGHADISNFTLSVGIPLQNIVAQANRRQAIELLALLLTAALALAATWLVGDVIILRRVKALVTAVGRIAGGDLSARSGIHGGRAELDQLALAVDAMADSLQERERERDAAQSRLFAEKERAQVTLASIGDAVITTDRFGLIEYMNPVAEALTGWTDATARNQPLNSVFHLINQHTREPISNPVELALAQGRIVTLDREAILVVPDGAEYAVEDSAAPIRDRERAITGAVLVFRDVSQSRKLAVQLSHQASHDPLTGLVNRREFERRLRNALESVDSQERHHSVLYMDLDRFKIVNDTCGHGAGDDLLRQVTALLQPLLRDSDTLARLGGDEFGALLENCLPDAAAQIADKLRQTICDFHFVWRDKMFFIGVSIGMVNFSNQMLTMDEILSAADSACYMAKTQGRRRVHTYHPEDDEMVVRRGQMEWMQRIQRAFRDNRFRLLSQEIVAAGAPDSSPVHHELLLRMVGENGEIVLPMAFIPAAERYGLMPAIDRWVIRTAFSHCAALAAQHDVAGSQIFSINVSGASLNDPAFLGYVCEQFAEFGVPYRHICFEITETTAIANLTKAMHFIRELRQLGCRFLLDDFGSGLSSFAYLKHLPVDFLKIDGAFVTDLTRNPVDCAMVEAINHIGHAMGIKTVAEWVENEATLIKLKAIGVDYVQGRAVAPLQSFYEG